MSLSNRELWIFMFGASVGQDKGDAGLMQAIIKYQFLCPKLGIAPLDHEEMARLASEIVETVANGAMQLAKEPIWEKRD